jgi:hypothetical protein
MVSHLGTKCRVRKDRCCLIFPSNLSHVEGSVRDSTTIELKSSILVKPLEAIGVVLTCYEEKLRDPDPQIRTIHIDHIVRTVSSLETASRRFNTGSYVGKVVGVLKNHRKLEGMRGLCEHLGPLLRPGTDY